MLSNRLVLLMAATTLTLWAGVGCVLREEKITVARDGSVAIEVEISGKVEELAGGDAMPSAESGWDVQRRTEEETKDGEVVENLKLTTEREFAPGATLPSSFAAPYDADADLYLEFPTEVTIEPRADGDYYIFRRSYTPRRWAYMQYWQDVVFDEDVQKLGEKPVEELSKGERRDVIEAFATVEACRQVQLADAALAESVPELSIDRKLQARQALLGAYEKYDLLGVSKAHLFAKETLAPVDPAAPTPRERVDQVIEQCDTLPGDARNECYDHAASELLSEAHDAYVNSLREEGGLDAVQMVRFEQSYERAQRYYDITGQLGGQHFDVVVQLPGTVVAHNGDEVETDDETGMSAVHWEFDGRAFRDRNHELIFVSRVDRGTEEKVGRPVHDNDR